MSSFRELVLRVEARARALGVGLSMAKLRDAISIALVDRPYSAAMAAEQAGVLGAAPLPPRHLERACERYRLDARVFAEAFAAEPTHADAVDVPRLFLDPVGLAARPPVFTVMLRDDAAPTRGNGYALCALDLNNYPPEIVAGRLESEYNRLWEEFARNRPADGLHLHLENLSSGAPAPLYKRYATQTSPQNAFVEIDARGNVTADWTGEIGNAVPEAVWHGRTLRFRVSPRVYGTALCNYLEGNGRTLLARIHAGHDVAWDGSNHRGRLSDDALDAKEQLETELVEIIEVEVWPVEEWLFDGEEPKFAVGRLWSTEALEDVASLLEEEAAEAEGIQLDGAVATALLEAAQASFEQDSGEGLTRNVVRTLVRRGPLDLIRYAEWIARANNGDNLNALGFNEATEAELDRDLPTASLYIMDSGASSEEIDRGRWAAEASFEASGVSVAQAYIASILQAEGVPHVAAHAAAWDEAERAAFAEAFKGWERHPESAVLVLG